LCSLDFTQDVLCFQQPNVREIDGFCEHCGRLGFVQVGKQGRPRPSVSLQKSVTALVVASQGGDADAARVRALAAYKDFLTLWKDADPDIPVLKEAKTEYAKLQ
jgi:hypothetical protein